MIKLFSLWLVLGCVILIILPGGQGHNIVDSVGENIIQVQIMDQLGQNGMPDIPWRWPGCFIMAEVSFFTRNSCQGTK